MLRYQLNTLAPGYPADRFVQADLKALPFGDETFDIVMCMAVLHFAENEEDFRQMFHQLVRVMRPGGKLLIRMTDDTGMEMADPVGGGKYHLPDGSVRFLLTRKLRETLLKEYTLRYAEPYKSVLVDGMRSMNMLILEK
jgi:ubiquinone/menaquinone biosynthesis C-methylase UbiE